MGEGCLVGVTRWWGALTAQGQTARLNGGGYINLFIVRWGGGGGVKVADPRSQCQILCHPLELPTPSTKNATDGHFSCALVLLIFKTAILPRNVFFVRFSFFSFFSFFCFFSFFSFFCF